MQPEGVVVEGLEVLFLFFKSIPACNLSLRSWQEGWRSRMEMRML